MCKNNDSKGHRTLDDLKNPPKFSVTPNEIKLLDNFLANSKGLADVNGHINITFSKSQWRVLRAIVNTFLWLIDLLHFGKIGVSIIRKILNIDIKTNSSTDQGKEGHDNNGKNPTGSDGLDNGDSKPIIPPLNDPNTPIPPKPDPKPGPKSRPNHNGKRTSGQIQGLTTIDVHHHSLKPGDPCSVPDCTGKVYFFLRNGKTREIISFTFSPPFEAQAYKMHDLRCNSCFTLFKSSLPEEVLANGGQEGGHFFYTYSAQTALSLLHCGFGMPMYRLDQFQSLVGERFPESTQFDLLEKVANAFRPVILKAKQLAANGYLLQGDDISNRIHHLEAELRANRSNGSVTYRDGVHTSILIATTSDGNLIPILKTGILHFGELLDEVLSLRSANMPLPYLVSDGSKVNNSSIVKTIDGGCWAHVREYFKKAKKHFPSEALLFMKKIKKIFEFDNNTHSMSAEDRLAVLQEKALPIVEKMKEQIDHETAAKKILPKSTLGQAFHYFQGQYNDLLMPFKHSGIPIHNNMSEWCTYLTARYTANSKGYQTTAGAVIGDTIMTIVLLSYLADTNPYHYILYGLKHKKEMKERPQDFLPWQLTGTIANLPAHKKMQFWRPVPPVGMGQLAIPTDPDT